MIPVVAGLVVSVITVQLGNWQLRRADEKIEIQTKVEHFAATEPTRVTDDAPDPEEWERVRITGAWEPGAVMYYDNRVHEGRPGYQILMPVEIGAGDWVLVNRGWIAAGRDRNALPDIAPPEGRANVSGIVWVPEEEPFSLTDTPNDGLRWQYIDLDAYRAWSGLPVRNWVLRQYSDSPDGLVRDWIAPEVGIDRHRGYALQWYSLAALAAALTGFYVFRSFRKHDEK